LAANVSIIVRLRARADDGKHSGKYCEQDVRPIVS
jgi:hypothetical protein